MESQEQGAVAELPKLTIRKFNGTNLDWTRFWGQFTKGIDQSSMAVITKFSYLKEFVVPKVRKSIDGLPFTPEGEQSGEGLCEGYPRTAIERLVETSPKRYINFTNGCCTMSSCSKTLGKLNKVNGNVALTIDKLPGIRGELVRSDEGWQSWDFLQLCAALKSWTHRNPVESNSVEPPPPPKIDRQSPACVYCEETSHKSADCPCMSTLDGKKKILGQGTGQWNVWVKCHVSCVQEDITLQFVMISVSRGRVLCLLLAIARLFILLWWLRLVELNVMPC